MNFSFGKYKNKAVAWVVFEDPGYIKWMYSEKMSHKPEYQFALNMISKFDEKPFIHVSCFGEGPEGCNNPVTRLSLYQGIYNGGHWFCDTCSIYALGARSGTLGVLKTYSEASHHRQSEEIIKALSNAKGVPARKTTKALKAYFGY
jgi:hypothetical protein